MHCSGVLVGAKWVLSAAHCACTAGDLFASVGAATPTRSGDLPNRTETVGLTDTVCFFGSEPGFCQSIGSAEGATFCTSQAALEGVPTDTPDGIAAHSAHYTQRDLALYELQEPLGLSLGGRGALAPFITTIGAPAHLPELTHLFVAGFGRNDAEARGGRKTYAHFASDAADCNGVETCVEGQEFVTADPNELIDSCFGDSGAGVFGIVPTGGLHLFGIVSRGVTELCKDGGINSTVAHDQVTGWIRSIVPDARIAPPPEVQLSQIEIPTDLNNQ